MKLFLTSAAHKVLPTIATMLGRPAKGMKLAFIPTASDPYGDNKPWMDADRAKLIELGFLVTDFDLKDKNEADTRAELSKYDVIFVAGGNTYYLLDYARKSGFLVVAKELAKKGTIYIGSSAGSYLACPTIEASGWKHADRNIVGLKDLRALGLVDFIVVAHYEPDLSEAIEAGKKSTKYPVIVLTDQQMVVVTDDKYEVVPC